MAGTNSLAWPPPTTATKTLSNDVVQLTGPDYSTKGGSATVMGQALNLAGLGGDLTYGIYTIDGLNTDVAVDDVSVNFSYSPDPPSQDTMLFIGVSNYSKDRWEWFEAGTSPWSFDYVVSSDYVSPSGTTSIACTITGINSARIESLTFSRLFAEDIPAPQNLHVTAVNVGEISLAWDSVSGVNGYHVYRSLYPDFRDPLQLTEEQITAMNSYTDDFFGLGKMYYYRVSAVRGSKESPLSNIIDIYCPTGDIPAPHNPHVVEVSTDYAIIGWEWDVLIDPGMEFDPDKFLIYVKAEPNFHVLIPITPQTAYGFQRTFKLRDLDPGVIYYYRIAAQDAAGRIGRMTDDRAVVTEDLWSWEDTETVATGSAPLSVVKLDGDFTVSYFNGTAVDIARRDNGTWTTHTTGFSNTGGEGGGFHINQSLDWDPANNNYIIAGRSANADDLYVTEGTLGGTWSTQEHLHGDLDTGMSHPSSMVNGRICVSDAGEATIIHWAADTTEMLLTQRLAGETAWTNSTLVDVNDGTVRIEADYIGTNLGVLYNSQIDPALYFGDSASSWTFTDITSGDGANIGYYNDMAIFNNDWMAIGYNGGVKDLYYFLPGDPAWTMDALSVHPIEVNAGLHCRLASDDQLTCAIYWKSPDNWDFGIYADGTWETQPLVYTIADLSPDPQLEVLNGVPYLLFVDPTDDTLKAVKGVAPEA